ncbi:MAG TPA: PSD1 and planctomycete cytochrome C domain-containing protein [Candidatus Saccharimonadia bacterium]|nr:PSD1 and planctomycete cytochrome C domain-containing protein [Candidatus Saccharimonadia bacterium]
MDFRPRSSRFRIAATCCGAVISFLLATTAGQAATTPDKPDPAALKFFESKIRPLLVNHCTECHGAKKQKHNLRLDNLAYMLEGGDSGPAVVPHDIEASLMLKAVSYEDADLQMPPDGKLEDEQIADLKKWVEMGAPWPEQEVKSVKMGESGEFSAEDRAWWAFQPLKPVTPPLLTHLKSEVKNQKSPLLTPIDLFVRARLEKEGMPASAPADRYELVRRVYFDLHGLPPTPEQVKVFVEDKRPDAYEKLVESLLNHPRYGERWAQHWLDLARYAESDGYRQDAYRPAAWPYRDYVVRSLNSDKPYDQFVREQLAGDEIAPENPDVLIATAYLRNGIYEYNQRDAETQRTTILNEVTDVSGELFLGLSFGCARCHDHKFDPILQKDYFRLQAFFAPVLWRDDLNLATKEEEAAHAAKQKQWEEMTTEARAPLDALLTAKKAALHKDAVEKFPAEVQAMMNKPEVEKKPYEKIMSYLVERQIIEEYDKLTPAKQKGEFKAKLEAALAPLKPFEEFQPAPLPVAFAATDVGTEAPPTVMKTRRGAEDVKPGFLTILDPSEPKIEPLKKLNSTGRRTALANWITRPDNPLSTRVIVNRLWQYHFGRGLAGSTSDFGRLGEKPTHPELLDWMAQEFVKHGWSLKWMHKEILMSATYQQTARVNPALLDTKGRAPHLVDPENRLLWRMNPMRLDAEQARDAVLAISGELKPDMGGKSEESAQPRRTLYTRKVRNSQDDFLRSFDAPPGFASVARRDSTTTALQSLLLINGDWPLNRARAMAARLLKLPEATTQEHVQRAYELALSRPPTKAELKGAINFVDHQKKLLEKDFPPAPILAGPLMDAKSLFGTHPLGGTKTVAFKPGTAFEKMRVQTTEAESDEFTVEAVVYLDSLYPDASVRTIAARWNNDKASKGWAFGVTSEKSKHLPNNLILQLCGDDFQGSVIYEVVASGLRIPVKTPYYVAAVLSHKLGPDQKFGGTVTFYTRNLADPNAPLEKVTVQHPVVGGYANPERQLTIGGRERDGRSLWDGAISRVVLTNQLLDDKQLLIGGVQSAPRCLFDAQAETLTNTSEPKFVWEKQPAKSPTGATISPRLEALADFCHALINSNEFLYLQ